jgi:hypothetical protein
VLWVRRAVPGDASRTAAEARYETRSSRSLCLQSHPCFQESCDILARPYEGARTDESYSGKLLFDDSVAFWPTSLVDAELLELPSPPLSLKLRPGFCPSCTKGSYLEISAFEVLGRWVRCLRCVDSGRGVAADPEAHCSRTGVGLC